MEKTKKIREATLVKENAEISPEEIKKYNLPPELNLKLQSLRCQTCKRFLAYYAIVEGTVAVKCKKCDTWNIVDSRQLKQRAIDKKKPESP